MKHLKTFNENAKEVIGEKIDVRSSIKYLKKLSPEYKEIALGLVIPRTRAKNGKVTGLALHPDLVKIISSNGYPNGFSMGIDMKGFFIHTHRARSKSYKNIEDIPESVMKFIDSTG